MCSSHSATHTRASRCTTDDEVYLTKYFTTSCSHSTHENRGNRALQKQAQHSLALQRQAAAVAAMLLTTTRQLCKCSTAPTQSTCRQDSSIATQAARRATRSGVSSRSHFCKHYAGHAVQKAQPVVPKAMKSCWCTTCCPSADWRLPQPEQKRWGHLLQGSNTQLVPCRQHIQTPRPQACRDTPLYLYISA